MKATVKPSKIHGSIVAPPSKSYTHRAITVGSLSESSEIFYPLVSEDILATVNACDAFGADITLSEKKASVKGFNGKPGIPKDVIDCKNSGTTLRFMSGIASLVRGITVLTGDESLRSRPNTPLLDALSDLGAKAISTRGNGCAPLIIKGRLKGGKIKIDGSISSQFISSLLIACPLAERDTSIEVRNLKSRPYVEMTLELIDVAGVKIESTEEGFKMEGNQEYDLKSFKIPGDFSSASYILAGAAITDSEVEVRNLFPSKQGDSAIVDILRSMGARISWERERGIVRVKGANLRGIFVDASETPDLVPTIAVLGLVAEGRTEISNVPHLRYKETDRLHALATELKKMGAKIEEKKDGLIIEKSILRGAGLKSYHDHRIAMAETLAGLVGRGETKIEDVECINISYPRFFDDMTSLGAEIALR
ncbi:MAG: 3-phosphoshikimate 1-carboxyvinyltransferase [Candidatus Syntropharchaeia archaeon]